MLYILAIVLGIFIATSMFRSSAEIRERVLQGTDPKETKKTRILNSLLFSIRNTLIVALLVGMVVVFGAPSLFGILFVTISSLSTVLIFGAGAFLVSLLWHIFTGRGSRLIKDE